MTPPKMFSNLLKFSHVMRAVGGCVGDVKIETSGGLGPRWPTKELGGRQRRRSVFLILVIQFFFPGKLFLSKTALIFSYNSSKDR